MSPHFINRSLVYTRVTDMQIRHNFLARHNQLPAKPPCRQQIELTFLWRSLPFANRRIPLWQNDRPGWRQHRHCFLFYGNMWEALEPPPAPSRFKTACSTASRWHLSLFPFVRGEPRSDAIWWILLEALSHGLRQWRLPGWVFSWLVNGTIVGGTSCTLSRVFLFSCSLFLCTYLPLPCSKWEWARERKL